MSSRRLEDQQMFAGNAINSKITVKAAEPGGIYFNEDAPSKTEI